MNILSLFLQYTRYTHFAELKIHFIIPVEDEIWNLCLQNQYSFNKHTDIILQDLARKNVYRFWS